MVTPVDFQTPDNLLTKWKGGVEGLKHVAALRSATTLSLHSAPLGDEAAAQMALQLAELMQEVANRHRGLVVKMLGDESGLEWVDGAREAIATTSTRSAARKATCPSQNATWLPAPCRSCSLPERPWSDLQARSVDLLPGVQRPALEGHAGGADHRRIGIPGVRSNPVVLHSRARRRAQDGCRAPARTPSCRRSCR